MNTNAQQGGLHSLLFDEGRLLENFKFFPGSGSNVTDEQLKLAAEEAVRAAFARGLTDNVPRTGRQKSTI